MVRILIVEDQKIMQKYFEYIIMQEPEFRHVQTVSDACEAVPERSSGKNIHIQRY